MDEKVIEENINDVEVKLTDFVYVNPEEVVEEGEGEESHFEDETVVNEKHKNKVSLDLEKSYDETHFMMEKEKELQQNLTEITKQLSRATFKLTKGTRGTFDSFLEDRDLEDDESLYSDSNSLVGVPKPNLNAIMSNFAVLPDLNEISLDSVVAAPVEEVKVIKEVKVEKSADAGRFVDPITGESIHSIHLEVEEEEEAEVEESISEEEEDETMKPLQIEEEDEDILKIIEKLDEEDRLLQPKASTDQESEKAMATFFEEIQKGPEEEVKESNSELLRHAAFVERQKKLINEFLNALIIRVVNMVEYIDEKTVLRKNLDKHKLLNQLLDYLYQQRADQRISQFLNRKVVEYFRRRKLFRNIVEGDVEQIAEEVQKYQASLVQVDTLLGYEHHAMKNKEYIEMKLERQREELKKMVLQEIENFENLVLQAFIRPDASERYVAAINNLIKKLRRERQEVTDFRRNLIYKQSLIAELHEQIRKLEHLGDNLTLSDYNHKLTETIGLTKLLDEREHQTGVMRKRCHEALHTVTHMMENISMEKSTVKIEYQRLNVTNSEKQRLREQIYRLKLQRIQVQQETTYAHELGGLISKPAVLLDYDRITECIPPLRQKVKNLKLTQAKLLERIEIMTQRCGHI